MYFTLLQVKIFSNAELALPSCIRKFCLRNIDHTKRFDLIKKNTLMSKVIIFLKGREFLENIEENTYANVSSKYLWIKHAAHSNSFPQSIELSFGEAVK